VNGAIELTWSAVSGQKYQLQYSANMSSWTNLGDLVLATNGTATYSDVTAPDPQRFYRLILIP
jgi:hypothetical protein